VLPLIIYGNTSPDFIGLNVNWILIPLLLYFCADGLMLPHLVSTALEPFKHQAGTAAAVAGFWRFFSAALIGFVASSSSKQHLLVLDVGVSAMGLLGSIVYAITLYGMHYEEFLADSKKTEYKFIDNYGTTHDGVIMIDGLDNEENKSMNRNINEQTPLIKKTVNIAQ